MEQPPQGKANPERLQVLPSASAQGKPGEDEPEQQEDGDVHAMLSRIALENQAIKAQLSQLTELVHQLLPQPDQASAQPGEEQAASAPWESPQPATTVSQTVGLPSPTWVQPDIPEGAPGPHTASALHACQAAASTALQQPSSEGCGPGNRGQQHT